MFTQKIVDSDAFLDMPLSAQCLYFHLNMRADDDGFVNNPKKIQRMLGATEDDLKLLLAKRFIIGFASGVIVIKHWRMHNLLRKDRHNPTQYQEEFNSLELKENGAYTEHGNLLETTWQPNGNQVTTDWQPNGNQMATQDSIGKDSIVEDIKHTVIEDAHESSFDKEFDDVWSLYPRKNGKQNACKAYVKARKEGTSKEDIIDGINRYVKYLKEMGTEERYIAYGSTWFNQRRWTDEYKVEESISNFDYDSLQEIAFRKALE